MGQPQPLFVYFRLFVQKILVASRIRTRIVEVEGKDADHLTTTTAQLGQISFFLPCCIPFVEKVVSLRFYDNGPGVKSPRNCSESPPPNYIIVCKKVYIALGGVVRLGIQFF